MSVGWPAALEQRWSLARSLARGCAHLSTDERHAWVSRAAPTSGAESATLIYVNEVTGASTWDRPTGYVDAATARAEVDGLLQRGLPPDEVAASLGLYPVNGTLLATRGALCDAAAVPPGGSPIDCTELTVALLQLERLLEMTSADDGAFLAAAGCFDVPYFVASLLTPRCPPPTAALALSLCARFACLSSELPSLLVCNSVAQLRALLGTALRIAACAVAGPAGASVDVAADGCPIVGATAPIGGVDEGMLASACCVIITASHASQCVLMAAERAEALGDEGTWAYKLSLLGFETADDVDAVLSRAGVWLARLLQRCRSDAGGAAILAVAASLHQLHAVLGTAAARGAVAKACRQLSVVSTPFKGNGGSLGIAGSNGRAAFGAVCDACGRMDADDDVSLDALDVQQPSGDLRFPTASSFPPGPIVSAMLAAAAAGADSPASLSPLVGLLNDASPLAARGGRSVAAATGHREWGAAAADVSIVRCCAVVSSAAHFAAAVVAFVRDASIAVGAVAQPAPGLDSSTSTTASGKADAASGAQEHDALPVRCHRDGLTRSPISALLRDEADAAVCADVVLRELVDRPSRPLLDLAAAAFVWTTADGRRHATPYRRASFGRALAAVAAVVAHDDALLAENARDLSLLWGPTPDS